MKRSEALAGLSRDHHKALSVALRLKRATPETLADALASFREYFETHGDRHFAVEEEVLLPEVADLKGGSALVDRVLGEHQALRALAAEVLAGAAVASANQLGADLDAHVRFEERELFPLLEQSLSEAELSALGERLAAAEARGS